jgi:hypothetical protein
LHDSIIGERLGLPAVSVMTTEFVSAADLMGRVLGAEGFTFVTIQHPISSATNDALIERGRKAAREAAEIIVG